MWHVPALKMKGVWGLGEDLSGGLGFQTSVGNVHKSIVIVIVL